MKKLIWVLLLIVSHELFAQLPKSRQTSPAKPKLVVAIVVDQFRYDYLLRFRNEYKGGIQQLIQKGAVFANARYNHFPTFTSVGHSTFLSGAYPSSSGIVGNQWYDRDAGKVVQSAEDDQVQLLGGRTGAGASPKRLMVSTIGDEMKIAEGKSKVLGLSLKDYSGILASGNMADAVFWFDPRTGNFVTSTHYVSDLPDWIKKQNAKRPAEKYKGAAWLGSRLPEEIGPKLYGAIMGTPFGNELVEEMAESAIESEQLGADAIPDLLVLSFSSNDYVGHQYGPDSAQVRDASVQTDRILGKLLKFLDAKVGMANVLVVFAADHGVAPTPELNMKRKMPGGRASFAAVRDAVQNSLTEAYGEGKWITAAPEEAIYLNWELVKSKKLDLDDVTRHAAQAIYAIPHVFRVYTRAQLMTGYAMQDPVGQRVMNSFSARRSADLYVLLDPYYLFGMGSTTHGSPFGYDTHVPLIFMGPGIKPGNYYESILINDVAPTLATMLGIEIPGGADGRILAEIFATP
jgi:predicted AlkP superfamily pyrophosphatase or phosphodiesterase